MRWAAVALACLVAVVGCTPPPPERDVPAFPERWELSGEIPDRLAQDAADRLGRQSTVRVRSLGCDSASVGAGVLLAPDVVVTARHVVEGARWVQVATWDGRSVAGQVDGVRLDADVAVLTLAEPLDGLPLPVFGAAEEGMDVVAVGHPDGGAVERSPGVVWELVDGEVFGEAATVVATDALVRPGFSGGPLLSVATGELVGVVFAYETASEGALAISAESVSAVLDELEAFETPQGGCGPSFG